MQNQGEDTENPGKAAQLRVPQRAPLVTVTGRFQYLYSVLVSEEMKIQSSILKRKQLL